MEKKPRPDPPETKKTEGPGRPFNVDGRVKLLDPFGNYAEAPYEMPESVEDWSPSSLPKGGQTATFSADGRSKRKHLPRRTGDPGP